MDWPTLTLVPVTLGILSVRVVGMRVSVSKEGFEVRGEGFLHWLHKASEERREPSTAVARPVNICLAHRSLNLP